MTASEDFVPEEEAPEMVLCFETRENIPRDEAMSIEVPQHLLRHREISYIVDSGQSVVSRCVHLWFHEDSGESCSLCGDYFPESWTNLINDYESDLACRVCMDEYVSRCGNCDYRQATNSLLYSDRTDEYYCDNGECYPQSHRSHLIQSYHHTVDNLTFRSWTVNGIARHRVRNMPYIGIEVETNIDDEDNLNDAAEFFLDGIENDYIILKEDGSINGFEIVTHPADYRVHLEMFPFEKLRRLSEYGMSAWSRTDTGIHVHISKNSFSSGSHLYKFMTFHDRNYEAIQRFAGRRSSYAKFGRMNGDNRVAMAKGQQTNYDRYVAVNIQPANTVELRYFRSSLRPATVKGIIQYSHALWQYTRDIRANDAVSKRALDWTQFSAWASDNIATYPDLHPLMSHRGVA